MFNFNCFLLAAFSLTLMNFDVQAAEPKAKWPSKTTYHTVQINGHETFYRQAGDRTAPVVVLLHGFPSSSHTYRELIPLLSGRYFVIAPDHLGSGFSSKPDPSRVTFDLLADQVDGLLDKLSITKFHLYMQDFGAPVGYRLILKDPKRLQSLIVQNANAYMEGLTEERQEFFMTAGDLKSKFPVSKLRAYVNKNAVINKQYLRDIPIPKRHIMSPDTWTHDLAFLETEKEREIQISLFRDYRTNLLAYPKWQEFLKKEQPKTLIVWGKHDPAFMASGAQAYLKHVPNAEIHLLDAGHFALEEKPVEIAKLMVQFIDKQSRP